MVLSIKNIQNQKNKILKIKGLRVWDGLKNLNSDNITYKINNYKNTIKNYNNELNEENKKNRILKKNSFNEINYKGNNLITSNEDVISSNTHNIISKANKKIKYINNSMKNIFKINQLYLTTDEPTESTNISQIYKNYKNNDNEYNKNKFNKNFKQNFSYINDIYRKQLNKAFMKFNPITYLENLYILQKIDSFVKKDINDLRKNIDENIKDLTDKHHYAKLYEIIHKKNLNNSLNKNNIYSSVNKSNSMKNLLPLNINKNNNNLFDLKIKLQNIKKRNINNYNNLNNNNIDKYKYNINQNNQNKNDNENIKNKKKFDLIREDKTEYSNKLKLITQSVEGLLDKNLLFKNIDNEILNHYTKENKNIYYEYEKQKEKTNNLFADLYTHDINTILKKNENNLKNKIKNEKENFSNKIENIKEDYLKFFNSYINENNIKLN